MNIDALKAAIVRRGTPAPENRFSVLVTLPQSIQNKFPGVASDLTLFCESAPLPARTLKTQSITTVKNEFKTPSGFDYEDAQLVFILPSDGSIKKLFDSWVELCVSPETYRVPYSTEYNGQVEVTSLDLKGQKIYTAIMEHAFPISVEAIPLSTTSTDSYAKVSVTFSFSSYLRK